MTAARRVVVTGLGFITPLGNDRRTVSANLRAGRHGLAPVEFLGNPRLTVKVAGTIKEFDVESPSWRDWRWPGAYDIPRETLRGLAPHGVYAMCAVNQALAAAALSPQQLAGDPETGLFCASAGSAMLLHYNIAKLRAAGGERGNPLGVVSSIAGTLNFNLAAHFGIVGGVCGFVSACASSSHALGYACDEIRLGRMRRVIVVGAEELNADTLLPFASMRALSSCADPERASRPFDVDRDGFVGAGGGVTLVLEEAGAAAARGAPVLAEISGWGQSADGHGVATSHPAGAGLQRAMQRALADARVPPAAVDYVNAHATSTQLGDRSEALALREVFTEAGAHPVVSSTKGLTGHPLSMSGAMEAAFCVLALADGFIPGNAHLSKPAPECAGLILPRDSQEIRPRVILHNSSGFGGSNVCHVLQRPASPAAGNDQSGLARVDD